MVELFNNIIIKKVEKASKIVLKEDEKLFKEMATNEQINMAKKTECPKCKSKDLSDGENDFIFFRGLEVPIQFCNTCHGEWLI